MGANSTQGLAVVLFLAGFTFLSGSMFTGSVLYLVPFVLSLAGSVALFLKCKPWEHQKS